MSRNSESMKRIATIRLTLGVEYIEQSANGVVFWRGGDDLLDVDFSFPVGLDFIEDFFARANRTLDVGRLPFPLNADPYGLLPSLPAAGSPQASRGEPRG